MTALGTLELGSYDPSVAAPDVTLQTFAVFQDVAAERARQDAEWGTTGHTPEVWLAILTEEVGEVAREVLGLRFGEAAKCHGDLRTELVQVAAVAVSAIESLDFGAAGLGRPSRGAS